ncbi:MAG: ABC transporter ATP-binding protein [Pseudomonadota bacterium]
MKPVPTASGLRRILPYLLQVWRSYLLALVLLFLGGILTAAKAWMIQPAVDRFIAGPLSIHMLWLLCGVVALLFILHAVLEWAYLTVSKSANVHVTCNIRADLFSSLMRHNLGYFVKHPSSSLVTRVINDVAVLEVFAIASLMGLVRSAVTLLLLLGVMLYQHLTLGLICTAVVVAAGLILRQMAKHIAVISRRIQSSLGNVANRLSEMIGGIELIMGFGLADFWRDRFSRVNQDYYQAQVHGVKVGTAPTILIQLIAGITLAVVLLIMGQALLNKEMTGGQLLSFLMVMYLMQNPAKRMGECTALLSQGLAAGERAFELLEEQHDDVVERQHRILSDCHGNLEFRHVSFSYTADPVLRDVTFSIKPRELVVMVGRSGAGKSSVAKLVQRFYDPDRGEVLIDGVDVRDIDVQSLYRAVSYVSQDVYLFNDTIEFNLKIGKPDATRAELETAMKIACVSDFIPLLPDGIQTVVGERGVRLSGGQRQRIAIARAVLSDAPILVLDEATSAVDMDLEQRIIDNLLSLGRQRTIFGITHRLTLAELADRVLVLRDGELVEEGTAAELAAANGEYAQLRCATDAGTAPLT